MTRRSLLSDGPNMLEIIQRNAHPLAPQQRNTWMGEMTHPAHEAARCPWPERLVLELTNTCNLDCPMCRIGEFGVDPDRFMSKELFEEVERQLFPLVREVRLNGLGEATILPWFEECVARVAAAGLRGELITNLTCNETTIRALVEAGFVMLVSWDAATPALFENLRRPSRWAEQFEKLRFSSRLATAANRRDHLLLLFTLQRANFEELPGMVELAAELGVAQILVNVVKLRNEDWIDHHHASIVAAIDRARVRADKLDVKLTLPDHIAHHRLDGLGVLPTSARGCDRPEREVVVRWNGEITVCNMFNPYTYGHVQRHGFERAWRGSLAQAFRRLVNTDNKHPYCEGCYYVHEVYERSGGRR
jgi:radical SAM protein with 4Fe4S-binding SPASM domain